MKLVESVKFSSFSSMIGHHFYDRMKVYYFQSYLTLFHFSRGLFKLHEKRIINVTGDYENQSAKKSNYHKSFFILITLLTILIFKKTKLKKIYCHENICTRFPQVYLLLHSSNHCHFFSSFLCWIINCKMKSSNPLVD